MGINRNIRSQLSNDEFETIADLSYLRLDTTNDPIINRLDLLTDISIGINKGISQSSIIRLNNDRARIKYNGSTQTFDIIADIGFDLKLFVDGDSNLAIQMNTVLGGDDIDIFKDINLQAKDLTTTGTITTTELIGNSGASNDTIFFREGGTTINGFRMVNSGNQTALIYSDTQNFQTQIKFLENQFIISVTNGFGNVNSMTMLGDKTTFEDVIHLDGGLRFDNGQDIKWNEGGKEGRIVVDDLFGIMLFDLTSSNGAIAIFDFRPNSSIFGMIIRDGDGNGTGAYLNIYSVAGSPNYTSFVVSSVKDLDALNIDSNNKIGIGRLSTGAKLDVDQSSTTASIPVLTLDQADISEEMIEFNTTIGTGNAIEAVGGKTLTTTHFIKVTITGGLTRYIPVGTIA